MASGSETIQKHSNTNDALQNNSVRIDFNIKEFLYAIPLKAPYLPNLSEARRKKLQYALDAFHQEDYETAFYYFKAFDGNVSENKYQFYIAVAAFMAGYYEEAAIHIQNAAVHDTESEMDYSPFQTACENLGHVLVHKPKKEKEILQHV